MLRSVAIPLWSAPAAPAPLDAVVTVPGSKSMTNRALVLAALAGGPSLIRRPLRSRDTSLMAAGVVALGARIDEEADAWRVHPPVPGRTGETAVDVGNAGTVMRFLLPLAALASGPVAFAGDERARERPIGPLIAALRELGADIDDGGRGALPLTVRGTGRLRGGRLTIDASSSSQLLSALLLTAPRTDAGIEVRHQGARLPSMPYITMTVEMLRSAGAEVTCDAPDVWRVAPGELHGIDLAIEPDLQNAAPFLAAALITGGRVTIAGWPRHTTQPGDALRELLPRMGAAVELGPEGLTVTGSGTPHGLDADLNDAGELVPTLAAVAALADSPSVLRGVGHLRGHESNRLEALATEINRLGGDVSEIADGLVIRPRPLHAGRFATYDDHRLATAGAVLGLAVPGIEVENVATTAKTMPEFTDLWARMLRG
jgi:3-phosphoshikimate 1-carboxyvinyltransferase